MDWQDSGILLFKRPHGEDAAILECFTAAHGRHLGVMRGGASRQKAGFLQPGHTLALTWRARLSAHIGHFTAEPLTARPGLLAGRGALAALNALCALLHLTLPERDPHPALFTASEALLAALENGADWPAPYLAWEVQLLRELGFALDLSECAVTGAREGLAYVSPRTGRAVTKAGAGEWADQLFPLPGVLLGGAGGLADFAAAFRITGHFLARALPEKRGETAGVLPQARARLLSSLDASADASPYKSSPEGGG